MTKKYYTKILPFAGGIAGFVLGFGVGLSFFADQVVNYGVVRQTKTLSGRHVAFFVTPTYSAILFPLVFCTAGGAGTGFLARKILLRYRKSST